MAVHTIRPETNQHFEILGLRISPEITGMSHTFAVEGKQVRITLPVIPEDAPKGAFPSWTGNHSIRYAGFNIVDGKHVPYVCDVTNIQITVTAQADLALPPDYIPTARMPDIPRHIQDVFQQVYVEQRQVAEQAFRHWRDVLRWKTLDGSLGRPQIVHHGHEQTVRDALTGTKVFSGVIALSGLIDAREGLDQPKWEHIQNLLATNTQAPIWFDFLFQGEYRRELGDVTEAVVNFAISCELLIRQLFVQEFPEFKNLSTGTTEIVDEVNIRTIINKWKRMRFWSKAWQDSFNVSELHHLFDARNKIMHSGHSAVSPDDSAKFAQVARHFVIATDALVKLSP